MWSEKLPTKAGFYCWREVGDDTPYPQIVKIFEESGELKCNFEFEKLGCTPIPLNEVSVREWFRLPECSRICFEAQFTISKEKLHELSNEAYLEHVRNACLKQYLDSCYPLTLEQRITLTAAFYSGFEASKQFFEMGINNND